MYCCFQLQPKETFLKKKVFSIFKNIVLNSRQCLTFKNIVICYRQVGLDILFKLLYFSLWELSYLG